MVLLNKVLLTWFGFRCAPSCGAAGMQNQALSAEPVRTHRAPILLTCCHMAGARRDAWLRPHAAHVDAAAAACTILAQAAARLGVFQLARLQSRTQLLKIVGLASIFCTSLACGNGALRFIPVSFVQVCALEMSVSVLKQVSLEVCGR